MLSARCFKQKPSPCLRFVDPLLQQAGGGNITGVITQIVRAAHACHERFVVFPQFAKHVSWSDVVGVIVGDSLQPVDMTDGPQRTTSYFSDSFGDVVGHSQ